MPSSAPNKVTPDKEDEPEEEEPFDDDLIEQALGKVEDITIEKLIDVGMMVGIQMTQMFRLSKRKCVERSIGGLRGLGIRIAINWTTSASCLCLWRWKAQSAI